MKRSSDLFKHALFLLLISMLAVCPAQAQGTKKKSKAKKPVVSTTAASRAKSRASQGGTTRVGTRTVIVTHKMVHGHLVRVTHVARAPQGPTYQTHPDTERYQQIQQALTTNGYFKGEANGQWGDDSVAALKQFQTDKKLPNDGKISSLSLIQLGLGPNRETASTPEPKSAAPASN